MKVHQSSHDFAKQKRNWIFFLIPLAFIYFSDQDYVLPILYHVYCDFVKEMSLFLTRYPLIPLRNIRNRGNDFVMNELYIVSTGQCLPYFQHSG